MSREQDVLEMAHDILAVLDPSRRVESAAAMQIASSLFQVSADSTDVAEAPQEFRE